jgi:hypothetical protein
MAICFSKFSWFLKFDSFQVKSHIEEFPRKQDLFKQLFFDASHLGTAVASVHEQTYTNTTHAHITHTPCTQTVPTIPHRFEDRVLKEITETIQGSVGDGRAAIPLWLHAREAAALVKMGKTPVGILSWGKLELKTGCSSPGARTARATARSLSTTFLTSLIYFFSCCGEVEVFTNFYSTPQAWVIVVSYDTCISI